MLNLKIKITRTKQKIRKSENINKLQQKKLSKDAVFPQTKKGPAQLNATVASDAVRQTYRRHSVDVCGQYKNSGHYHIA